MMKNNETYLKYLGCLHCTIFKVCLTISKEMCMKWFKAFNQKSQGMVTRTHNDFDVGKTIFGGKKIEGVNGKTRKSVPEKK